MKRPEWNLEFVIFIVLSEVAVGRTKNCIAGVRLSLKTPDESESTYSHSRGDAVENMFTTRITTSNVPCCLIYLRPAEICNFGRY